MNIEQIQKLLQTWAFEDRDPLFRRYASMPSWNLPSVSDVELVELSVVEGCGIDAVVLSGNVGSRFSSNLFLCEIVFTLQDGGFSWGVDCECDKGVCEHAYHLLVAGRRKFAQAGVPASVRSWVERAKRYQAPPVSLPVRDLSVGLILHTDTSEVATGRLAPISTMLLAPPASPSSRKPLVVPRSYPGVMSRLLPGETSKLALLELNTHGDAGRLPRASTFFVVATAEQEQVFDDILQNGRIYLDRFVGSPLRRGEDVTPSTEWTWSTDSTLKLCLLLPDQTPVRLAARLHGLWYIQNGAMGRLLGDPDFMSMITAAPAVTSSQVTAVSGFWKEHAFATPLPAPPEVATIRDIKVAPEAVITVQRQVLPGIDGAADRGVPVAQLSVTYEGVALSPRHFNAGGYVIRRVGTESVRIFADVDAQFQFTSSVLRSGLQPASHLPDIRGENAFVNASSEAALDDFEHFLRAIDRCEAMGLRVVMKDDLPFVNVEQATPYASLSSVATAAGESSQWFDLAMGMTIDGKRQDLGPVVSAALADPAFHLTAQPNEPAAARWTVRLDDGQLVRIPLVDLRKLVAPIAELMDAETRLIDGKVRLGKFRAAMAALDLGSPIPRVLSKLRTGMSHMREIAVAPLPRTPAGFVGELMPYQREGLRWLNALAGAELGGVLADDMGLGKTIEVLAHLVHLKDHGKLPYPVLVVVPKSLINNWFNEAARFTPSLRVLTIQGHGRASKHATIQGYDVIVTTYNVLPRDIALFEQQRFTLVVCDESQMVKSSTVQAAKALRRLTTQTTLCLTGTPLENHHGDLWSQMDLALPGFLGDLREFNRIYRTPIEKHNDVDKKVRLTRRIHPFVLRRTKENVAKDLPAKTVSIVSIELEDDQRLLYESLRISMVAEVREAIAAHGIKNAGVVIFSALMRLRQACCHPQLVKLESAKAVRGHAKLDVLMGMLRGTVAEGRCTLVFSFFTSMLQLIAQALDAEQIPYLILTGATEDRAELIARFQTGETPVFLLSLKAGGVGLNLTAADTVIHYDPWWNPAAENQATDRAHRIGQTKPVHVYNLICDDTIESKIQALKLRKSALADSILDGAATSLTRLTEEDINELFAATP